MSASPKSPLRERMEEVDEIALGDLNGEVRNVELEAAVRRILELIGEDPSRQGLVRTPLRVARALETLTSGYMMSVEKIVNNAIFDEDYNEIVSVKNIHFFSLCEHHMLPFFGIANVGYIPNGKVIGLSKIPRIVDMFARRLQLQERLTTQVAECLNKILQPRGVAVVMEAYHLCMMMRGVEKQDCLTVTSCMLGDFKTNVQTRNEFLELCGRHSLKSR
ncbi:MAG: GTP cyclohydrolase I FolE [Candidatus Sumerlaeaceae bacterium]